MSTERRRGRGRNAGGPRNDGGQGGEGGGRNRARRSRRGRGANTNTPQQARGNAGGGGGGGGGGNRGRKGGNNRRRRLEHLHDQDRFWGDPDALPEVEQDVRITDHPAAVPLSLGPPPLPGHEKIAEHYFGVVYERAVGTAGALAAAGGLIEPESLLGDD
ncbi:hypothetical protein FTX61_13250 [Nitriliruptoraceae bacterium ZYF776]|nr:hypothetical protein [Profundirhabdus halotolerans]